jgi:hypothetical protein
MAKKVNTKLSIETFVLNSLFVLDGMWRPDHDGEQLEKLMHPHNNPIPLALLPPPPPSADFFTRNNAIDLPKEIRKKSVSVNLPIMRQPTAIIVHPAEIVEDSSNNSPSSEMSISSPNYFTLHPYLVKRIDLVPKFVTNTENYGSVVYQICKEPLHNGWIKVASEQRKLLLTHLNSIAAIAGMNADDIVRIKISTKVAHGTNNKRNDCKKLQSMKDVYLNNSRNLLNLLFKEIDLYSNYKPEKAFSVIECFQQSLDNAANCYASFSWKDLENEVYSKYGEEFTSERNLKRRKLVDERNNRCRAFREMHMPEDDFKSSFGFDVSRLAKGGSWGNAESKEVAIHLKAIGDLVLTTKWIPEEHWMVRSAIVGALYVVASHGEHNPYNCYEF